MGENIFTVVSEEGEVFTSSSTLDIAKFIIVGSKYEGSYAASNLETCRIKDILSTMVDGETFCSYKFDITKTTPILSGGRLY